MPHHEFEDNHKGSSTNPLSGDIHHTDVHEMQLFEYLDGSLPPAESKAVEARLANCPECRDLALQWRQVDDVLTHELKRPALSKDFSARLLQRVERESVPVKPVSSAPLSSKWEAELNAEWVDYRKKVLRRQLPAALDYLGYGAITAVLACLFVRLAPKWLNSIPQLSNATNHQWMLLLATGTAIIVLLSTVAFIARNRISRWVAGF